jgi:hypothetical protein
VPAQGRVFQGENNNFLAEKRFAVIFERRDQALQAYQTDKETFRKGGRLGSFVCSNICESLPIPEGFFINH